jgi:hypothetical protein
MAASPVPAGIASSHGAVLPAWPWKLVRMTCGARGPRRWPPRPPRRPPGWVRCGDPDGGHRARRAEPAEGARARGLPSRPPWARPRHDTERGIQRPLRDAAWPVAFGTVITGSNGRVPSSRPGASTNELRSPARSGIRARVNPKTSAIARAPPARPTEPALFQTLTVRAARVRRRRLRVSSYIVNPSQATREADPGHQRHAGLSTC